MLSFLNIADMIPGAKGAQPVTARQGQAMDAQPENWQSQAAAFMKILADLAPGVQTMGMEQAGMPSGEPATVCTDEFSPWQMDPSYMHRACAMLEWLSRNPSDAEADLTALVDSLDWGRTGPPSADGAVIEGNEDGSADILPEDQVLDHYPWFGLYPADRPLAATPSIEAIDPSLGSAGASAAGMPGAFDAEKLLPTEPIAGQPPADVQTAAAASAPAQASDPTVLKMDPNGPADMAQQSVGSNAAANDRISSADDPALPSPASAPGRSAEQPVAPERDFHDSRSQSRSSAEEGMAATSAGREKPTVKAYSFKPLSDSPSTEQNTASHQDLNPDDDTSGKNRPPLAVLPDKARPSRLSETAGASQRPAERGLFSSPDAAPTENAGNKGPNGEISLSYNDREGQADTKATLEPAVETDHPIPGSARLPSGADRSVRPLATGSDAAGTIVEDRIDVIRQIVQRMSLHQLGSQKQMVIHLKPELLGRLRMQIVTENHQVAVRMTAESHAVKNMIETNLAHLKTELSKHGLEIQKIEVTVQAENEGGRNGQTPAGFEQGAQRREYQHRRRHALGNQPMESNARSAAIDQPAAFQPHNRNGDVDYFA